jgi:GT2 family glycosyltransferase
MLSGAQLDDAAAVAEPATANDPARPFFSVIVPVHDGGEDLGRCLDALARSTFRDFELLVVDDASRDGSAELAAARGARVIRRSVRGGPAAARNDGAQAARGEVLFFVDADCELAEDALERSAARLRAEPGLDALFGSYDDRPGASDPVSQFKNLYHHWTHQQAGGEARTFWAGCGAVRRERFLALGGFDARRYPVPSIEDIELGYRLTEGGGRIALAPDVQARHLKRWRLGDLVRTDVLRRGAPWTELLFERPGRGSELNLAGRGRLVVVASGIAIVALLLAPWVPELLLLAGVALGTMIFVSRGFYALVWRRGGPLAAAGALPLHVLYGCCSALGFALGATRALARGRIRGE